MTAIELPKVDVPARDALVWLRWIVIVASAAGAAIHGAGIATHMDHGTKYGMAFIVMTVLQGAIALAALLSRRAITLVGAAAVNIGIIALWFVAHTTTWTGEKEAAGLPAAVATMLEVAAVIAALGLLVSRRSPSLRSSPVLVPLVTLATIGLLSGPAIAQADDHEHADSANHAHADTAAAPHEHDTGAAPNSTAAGGVSIMGAFSGQSAHAHDGTAAPVCVPAAADIKAADRLLADTTLAVQKWRDVNTAVADGYRPLGFEPNGVHHYINANYRNDGHTLDPTKPESILYGRTKDGGLYPVGVMYMLDDTKGVGPRIGGCITTWHRHGFPFAKPGELSTEMMHVWTVPLPGGPFAEHVEAEYARIYMGVEGFDEDGNSTSGSGANGAASTTLSSAQQAGLARLLDLGGSGATGFNVGTLLNSLNVHREVFCEPTLRARIEARAGKKLMDRVCDPVMNGALPGAKAPDIATVLSALAQAAAAAPR